MANQIDPTEILSKKEKRRLRRQEEELNQLSLKRSRTIKKVLKIVAATAAVVVVILGLINWVKKSEAEKPGVAVEIQPAVHIRPGEPIPGIYLSNPPVSGWHYPQPAEWGIYDEPLSDQTIVHNLEHGGIWISYRPDAPQELIDNLKRVTGKFKRKVILTPRPANDSLIALGAWGRLDKFDYFDEARILRFIKAYKDKGPEFVP